MVGPDRLSVENIERKLSWMVIKTFKKLKGLFKNLILKTKPLNKDEKEIV